MKTLLYFLLVWALPTLAFVPQQAIAAETIQNFHSGITLTPNATLVARETITISAGREQAGPNIYRDFPLSFRDKDNRERKVDFTIISVKRDGQPEEYHLDQQDNHLRINIGSKDIRLPAGTYTYEITYQTDHHVQFFDNHDEFFWDVTGSSWNLPIEKAKASIMLPDKARIEKLATFTGAVGSNQNNASYTISPNGNGVYIKTTSPLGPHERLAFSLAFQKGVVTPSGSDWLDGFLPNFELSGSLPNFELNGLFTNIKLKEVFTNNKLLLFATFATILLLCYYLWFWLEVGRDPPKGAVVPRWDIPKDISPALANYVTEKNFRFNPDRAFSAAITSLAVKGYIKLKPGETQSGASGLATEKSLQITATGKPVEQNLPVGERVLLNKFCYSGFGRNNITIIDRANSNKIRRIVDEFSHAMENEHRNKYYTHNRGYVICGALISFCVILGLCALADFSAIHLTLSKIMMVVLPIGFPFFIYFQYTRLFLRKFDYSRPAKFLIFGYLAYSLVPIFSRLFFAGALLGFGSTTSSESTLLIFFSTLIIGLNVLFYFLMGAPTPLGKEVSQHLEGLRTYLSFAETDRLNPAYVSQDSPQQFEKFLPYAIALGVEEHWTRAFKSCLSTDPKSNAGFSFMEGNYSNFYGDDSGFDVEKVSDTIVSPLQEAMAR